MTAEASEGRRASGSGSVSVMGDESEHDVRGQDDYLSPLQRSLLFELTTRRARITGAHARADYWHNRQQHDEAAGKDGEQDRFQADVLDSSFLAQLIDTRRQELARLRESKQLKEAIVQSADAAHAIGASMAASSPGPYDGPRLHQPLRSMAARRDELALEYLRLDAELKHVQDQRRDVAGRIDATRAQTSSLIDEVRTRSHEREERRHRSLVSTAKRHEASRKLQEELQVVRGKREMVKGVLRGIIMESGLDWYGSRELRALVLELGDDDLDASDEEPDFESDEGLEDGDGG